MMVFKKNQIIVVVLLLLITVASYISWSTKNDQYAGLFSKEDSENEELGTAIFTTKSKEEEKKEVSEGEEETEEKKETAYITEGKMEREKLYEATIAQKNSMLKEELEKEDKDKIHSTIETLDKEFKTALEIERLLTARGYDQTLVTFGEEGNVNVDIKAANVEITKDDVAIIKNVVLDQYNTEDTKVVIYPID